MSVKYLRNIAHLLAVQFAEGDRQAYANPGLRIWHAATHNFIFEYFCKQSHSRPAATQSEPQNLFSRPHVDHRCEFITSNFFSPSPVNINKKSFSVCSKAGHFLHLRLREARRPIYHEHDSNSKSNAYDVFHLWELQALSLGNEETKGECEHRKVNPRFAWGTRKIFLVFGVRGLHSSHTIIWIKKL